MSTQLNIDCALMAGAAYRSTRDSINRFPIPDGWSEIPLFHVFKPSGFEAVSFQCDNKIVISFAGTYNKDYLGDWAADIGLASGLGSTQLLQAAEYYLQVKATNSNPETEITFTGHSLGGGLAALMGVFFNEEAVTFDQAPFRNSAIGKIAIALRAALTLKFPDETYPLVADWLNPLDNFILSLDPFGQGWSKDGLAAREAANVTAINVQGEFLSNDFINYFKIGTSADPNILKHGNTDISGGDLHSQALLTAFMLDDRFRQVTYELTDMLGR